MKQHHELAPSKDLISWKRLKTFTRGIEKKKKKKQNGERDRHLDGKLEQPNLSKSKRNGQIGRSVIIHSKVFPGKATNWMMWRRDKRRN